MQIRLSIGIKDQQYLNLLLNFFERNYMDVLELYSFSSPERLISHLSEVQTDMILMEEGFGIDFQKVQRYGKVLWLCEGSGGPEGGRHIAKYRKPELIYKDILDFYADCGGKSAQRGESRLSKMVLITGFSGGCGSSTVAAAAAKYLSLEGYRVLYLNLENTGSSSCFFSGAGNYCFDDVIYAIKSQKADLRLKLESTVRRDGSGVYFFESCKNSMYMLELSKDDRLKILSELQKMGVYQYVILDTDFILGEDITGIMDCMNRVIVVSDGTETANAHFIKAYEALDILQKQTGRSLNGKLALLYNKFSSSKSSSQLNEVRLPVLGVFPPVKHALVKEIIEVMLDKKDIFEKMK